MPGENLVKMSKLLFAANKSNTSKTSTLSNAGYKRVFDDMEYFYEQNVGSGELANLSRLHHSLALMHARVGNKNLRDFHFKRHKLYGSHKGDIEKVNAYSDELL